MHKFSINCQAVVAQVEVEQIVVVVTVVFIVIIIANFHPKILPFESFFFFQMNSSLLLWLCTFKICFLTENNTYVE